MNAQCSTTTTIYKLLQVFLETAIWFFFNESGKNFNILTLAHSSMRHASIPQLT